MEWEERGEHEDKHNVWGSFGSETGENRLGRQLVYYWQKFAVQLGEKSWSDDAGATTT